MGEFRLVVNYNVNNNKLVTLENIPDPMKVGGLQRLVVDSDY
jgi:hypothetical protein